MLPWWMTGRQSSVQSESPLTYSKEARLTLCPLMRPRGQSQCMVFLE